MKAENIIEVVRKLTGQINPVGESTEDHFRLENLKMLCEVVNELVSDIDHVAYRYKNRYEHSIKECQKHAENFITNTLGIKE